MKIGLSTDTSCTISKELATKLNIHVFPLNVIVNGEEFLDGVSIDQDQLCADMRGGKIIKTSTPPIGDIVPYFEDLFKQGYDKIIHFTISSKLSSMFQLFTNVSRDYFDNKIVVIDAYCVCSAMLSKVIHTHQLIEEGKSIEEIVARMEERKSDLKITFVPENLTALKNGGRISPAIAALGNMIGLKPVLVLQDGGLEKRAMTRNVKKTIVEEINELAPNYDASKYDYTIVSFDGNKALIDAFVNEVKRHFPEETVNVLPIAINVCAHAGPGTVGLVVSPKMDGKSLNDYL